MATKLYKIIFRILILFFLIKISACALEVGNPDQEPSSATSDEDSSEVSNDEAGESFADDLSVAENDGSSTSLDPLTGITDLGSSDDLIRDTVNGIFNIRNKFFKTNPNSSGSVVINVRNKMSRIIGTLTLEEIKISIEDILLERSITNSGSYQLDGPFVLDLIDETIEPNIGTFVFNVNEYENILLTNHVVTGTEVDKSGENLYATDDAIIGNNVSIRGFYTGETDTGYAETAPFQTSFSLTESISSSLSYSGEIQAGYYYEMEIEIDPTQWFDFSLNGNDEDASNLIISSTDTANSGDAIMDESPLMLNSTNDMTEVSIYDDNKIEDLNFINIIKANISNSVNINITELTNEPEN